MELFVKLFTPVFIGVDYIPGNSINTYWLKYPTEVVVRPTRMFRVVPLAAHMVAE